MKSETLSQSPFRSIGLFVGLGVFLSTAAPVQAMDHDVWVVMRSGLYGVAAGLVAGAISYPISHNSESFIDGPLVGLAAGLSFGLYLVLDRPDLSQVRWDRERALLSGEQVRLAGFGAGAFRYGMSRAGGIGRFGVETFAGRGLSGAGGAYGRSIPPAFETSVVVYRY